MKKKVIISSIIILLIIIAVFCFNLWNKRTVSIITLDINPSIEIHLDKNEKIKRIVALNNDAKGVIKGDFEGKSLNETLNIIVKNVIDQGFVGENQVTLLLYSKGQVNNDDIKNTLEKEFGEKDISSDIFIINNITKKDEELAKRYNISLAKASYINSITDNMDISVNNLVDNSVQELRDTKETGNYCDNGYKLQGADCLKEIERVSAKSGDICPGGYFEYNDKCYEEVASLETNNLTCRDEFYLSGDKCIRERTYEATAVKSSCSSGELVKKSDVGLSVRGSGDDDYICVDRSSGEKPKLRCLTINHTMVNGQCFVGPAPVINGGCPNNDLLLGGGCYSKDDGDQWICPDGRIYEKSKNSVPDICPDTIKYTKAQISEYRCDSGGELRGNDCIIKEEEPAEKERMCSSGYNLINNDRCINYNKTIAKQKGYYCDMKDSRLEGNECVIYEIVKANHK